MTFYTENLCPNPSFQDGLLGYSTLLGSDIVLDTRKKLFGSSQSLMITTPGLAAGEGAITAGGLITTSEVCSASLFIQGTGMVNVSADVNPGASVAGTVPVTLVNNSWQRVVIENISCTPGQTLYLTAYTTSAQIISFWICGIQIEADPTVHDYCDGNQPGCFWLSGPPGISYQPYQFSAQAAGLSYASGNVPVAVVQGQSFFTVPDGGISQASGNLVQVGAVDPIAAFDDFAIYEADDLDPAQTYVNGNNALSNSGTSGNYSRIFSTFYGPLDYLISNGNTLWNRAAYAAVGFKFSSVPSSGTQNISDVQIEILPMTASAPSTYSLPREIKTIIIPDRLNFCPNPSVETSTANWSALGSATLSQDTIFSPNTSVNDDVETSNGHSLKLTLNTSSDGAQISITSLIVGNTYTVSAYVLPGTGIANITLICGPASGSAAAVGSSLGFGTGTYGDPPYGGVVETGTDLDTSTWYRPFFTFTANQSTETFEVLFTPGSDISYPANMWIDDVLVEVGENLGDYFDGNFGPNYFWGGTVNLSKSYLYDQFAVKSQAVNNVLSKHVPLGISFATPRYHTAYTQE